MIKNMFHRHVPQIDQTISQHDPQQRNHPSNEQTQVNIGGDMSQQVRLPALSLNN
jgi:hypothetical protein